MGIWRQTKTRKRPEPTAAHSLFENSDPFEFDDSFVGSFRSGEAQASSIPTRSKVVAKQSLRTHKAAGTSLDASKDFLDADFSRIAKIRSSRNLLVYGVLALALTCIGFTLAKFRPWAMWGSPELVYAYFEVRAVDGAGRPVAGASVKNAGKKVGTTDSFGEWRRYMRVPLGSTVPITISKATTGEPLYAIKNFAVPPEKPEKSDMELRASVQLQTGAAGVVAASAPSVIANPAVAPKAVAAVANDTLVGSQTPAAAPVVEKKPEIATTLPATTIAEAKEQASVAFASSHESIWFDAGSGPANAILQQSVVPALIQRAKELGLKVDQHAQWHVRLDSLMDPPRNIGAEGAGLIQITTSDQSANSRQFLRNYLSDSRMTARGILYVLSHQVNKNVAIIQKDNRWVAVLPKDSSELWRVAGGMSLSGTSREWLVGVETYGDAKFQGYYLAASENPCGAGRSSCELKTRSFQESPAVPTWTRLKMRLVSAAKEKDSMKVFVSGYEARPVGDNVVEYWGQDRAKANVTVVQNGKVVHRLQIVNDLRQPANVALGVASMSRR